MGDTREWWDNVAVVEGVGGRARQRVGVLGLAQGARASGGLDAVRGPLGLFALVRGLLLVLRLDAVPELGRLMHHIGDHAVPVREVVEEVLLRGEP